MYLKLNEKLEDFNAQVMEMRIPGLPVNQEKKSDLCFSALLSAVRMRLLNVSRVVLYLRHDEKMHSSTHLFSIPFSKVPYPKTSVVPGQRRIILVYVSP